MWKSNLHRERQSRDTKAQPGQTNWTFWNRTFRSRDSKVVHRLVKEEQGTRNTYLASPRETRCCTLLKPCRSWLGGQPRISCREHLYIFVASFFFCFVLLSYLNLILKCVLQSIFSVVAVVEWEKWASSHANSTLGFNGWSIRSM